MQMHQGGGLRVITTTYKAESEETALALIESLESGGYPFILVVPTKEEGNVLRLNAVLRNLPSEESALTALVYLGADAAEMLEGRGRRVNDFDDE